MKLIGREWIQLGFFLSLFLAPLSGFAEEEAAVQPDTVVAKVNGTKIMSSEIDRALQTAVAQNPQLAAVIASGEQADAFRKSMVDQLIATELLYQEGKKLKIKDLKTLVDAEEEQLKNRFPNPGDFETLLKEQNLTEAVLREKIEKGIRIQKLLDEKIKNKISIPYAEIKSFYEENQDKFVQQEAVKASHILVRIEEGSDEAANQAAQKKSKALLKRVRAGEDFATLAKENSEDPSAAQNSGNLGYFTREQMVPEFSEAAFALKVGDVSDLVKTAYGYHIIKCEDKKAEQQLPFEHVREDIAQYKQEMAFQTKLSDYIATLKKSAKVNVF
ncbi:MAG: peptidylprolyl isomerase [bacterium]|nr:peptidylprolyl isomerase [bacterium]